jgi:hypothetical protein
VIITPNLDANAGPVEVVAVQFFEDLVDLGPAGLGVDVDEAVVLDDVGLLESIL